MRSPHYEVLAGGAEAPRRVGGVMPKYRLTEGRTSRRLAMSVEAVLPLADQLEDDVPEPVRRRQAMMPLAEAVRLGHQAESRADWERARERFRFGTLLELQSAFLIGRRRISAERATPIPYRQEVIDRFQAGLEFALTNAHRPSPLHVFPG